MKNVGRSRRARGRRGAAGLRAGGPRGARHRPRPLHVRARRAGAPGAALRGAGAGRAGLLRAGGALLPTVIFQWFPFKDLPEARLRRSTPNFRNF